MIEFKLKENMINTILEYLGTKPFNEVAKLINDIQKECHEQARAEEPKQQQVIE